MVFKSLTSAAALLASLASCETIADITGNRFLSPLADQGVTDVRGVVTAKGPDGYWIRSTRPRNSRVGSRSVYIYGNDTLDSVSVGNVVTLNGRVEEYRSSDDYLYVTEIVDAANVTIVSEDGTVTPLVIGRAGLNPPREVYTNLDEGDIFGVPNNVSQVSAANPTLQPRRFGLDFWESLSGELVTVRTPRAISKPNQYGDTWVVGAWRTTGDNDRGGLTVTDEDANPEAVIILAPLDGSENPQDTKVGDSLAEITGIVQYAFGNYGIYPQSALVVTSSQEPALPPASSLTSSGDCSGLNLAQYNVENLSPEKDTFAAIADQIVIYLNSPDLLFLQEIQDNNGATDDGTVSGNLTLSLLVSAISDAGSEVSYSYVEIPPVDGEEGGEPGGNIRVAYLYNSDIVELYNPTPGSSTDATEVLPNAEGLTLNPGRIDPSNSAWENSRVPLAAAWSVVETGDIFFTVNVHWTSKGGGTSLFGDARPPVNGGVEQRQAQAEATGAFIASILAEDADAAVISAGDYNEFAFVAPMETFVSTSGLQDLDIVVGIPETERYTYVFGQNSQQLDHMHVSPRLEDGAEFEHVHVSSWVSFADQVSDHDPSVARLDVCAV